METRKRTLFLLATAMALVLLSTNASYADEEYLGVFSSGTGSNKAYRFEGWAKFLAEGSKLVGQNLRLVDVEAVINGDKTDYIGVWSGGNDPGNIVNRSKSWQEFLAKGNELVRRNLRLVDLEVVGCTPGSREFIGIWRSGTEPGNLVTQSESWEEFLAKGNELVKKQLRLVDVEAARTGSKIEYFGVWRSGSDPGNYVYKADSWEEFLAKGNELIEKKLRLVDVEVVRLASEGKKQYIGVWRSGTDPNNVIVRVPSWNEFLAKGKELVSKGLRLIDMSALGPPCAGVGEDVAGNVPPVFEEPGGDVALPFRSLEFQVTADQISSVMSSVPDVSEKRTISVNGIDKNLLIRCHIQGVAVGSKRVITSCMSEGQGKNDHPRRGYLQIYDEKGTSKLVSVYGPPHQHAVVGQPVFGRDVRANNGAVLKASIDMMVPVISGRWSNDSSARCPQTPVIDLRDQDGNLIFSFCHKPHAEDKGGLNNDLSAGALFVHKGKLYLFGVYHDFLYIYRLNWSGPANKEKAHVEVEPVLKARVKSFFNVVDGGAGDTVWANYESINLFSNHQGKVFLIAGHDEWLDTWEIELSPPANAKPKLRKLANAKEFLNAGGVNDLGKDLFYEGVSIQKLSDTSMRIWVTPWDYRHSRCWPISKERHCSYIWHFDWRF